MKMTFPWKAAFTDRGAGASVQFSVAERLQGGAFNAETAESTLTLSLTDLKFVILYRCSTLPCIEVRVSPTQQLKSCASTTDVDGMATRSQARMQGGMFHLEICCDQRHGRASFGRLSPRSGFDP